jgi:hypothetical protein
LRIKRFLPLTIVLTLVLVGCTQTDIADGDKIHGKQIGKELKNVLNPPDKMILYVDGTSKEIVKSDARFVQIVDLTNTRFHDKLSTVNDIVDDDAMEYIRKDGMGIEFVYFKENELSIKGDGFRPLRYSKLYFPLTSKRFGYAQGSKVHTFQHAENGSYTEYSRGPLEYSEELVDLVKVIVQQ